jgi:DNA-binding response OmpR family regulator
MRVLVVEDERPLARSVSLALEAHGFSVDIVHDGNEAVWSAEHGNYAAIILDILLPGRNGYQVCSWLREQGNDTPILMLTAKDGEYDEAEGLDTGADDYLRKPFSYVVLVARLRALLRRGRGAPAELSVGDLVLDPARRTCQRAGRRIELTTKEFLVLECLMRRSGEVVGKAEILEQVWDLHLDASPNLVEVYVSALRRKVDTPFAVHSIHTVRGAGYWLEAVSA